MTAPRRARDGARVRVLVVDDSACSRAALAALLTTVDCVDLVGVAADGPEALAMLDARAPDVVLADVRMPGMDGLELTRRIRAARPTMRVVLLTVCAAYRGAAAEAGADAFLVKGCAADDLVEALCAAEPRPRLSPLRRPTAPVARL